MNNNIITAGILVAMAFAAVSADATAQTRTPPAAAPARAATPTAAPPVPATPAQPAPSSSVEDRAAVKGSEVIARVGDSDVTADEVRATLALLDNRQQAAMARDPALLSQTVRAILANRLVLKEALAKKWDQQPAIAAQLARARENLIVEIYLQSITAPPESYPSEAEIKSVYEANANTFLVPRRYQLAQIVVAVAKDADKPAEDAARKKLDDVVEKGKAAGRGFCRARPQRFRRHGQGRAGWRDRLGVRAGPAA